MVHTAMDELWVIANNAGQDYLGKLVDNDAEAIRTAHGLLSGRIEITERMASTEEEERIERAEVMLSHLRRTQDMPIYQEGKDEPKNLGYPGNVVRTSVGIIEKAIEDFRRDYETRNAVEHNVQR